MEERVYFDDRRGVRITSSRAIFWHQTYAMAQISSVAGIENKPDRTWAGALIVFGILGLMLGVFMAVIGYSGSSDGMGGCGIFIIVSALALGLLGLFLWVTKKTIYVVRLRTSGGEVDALWSPNYQYARQILDAMNNAIVGRG